LVIYTENNRQSDIDSLCVYSRWQMSFIIIARTKKKKYSIFEYSVCFSFIVAIDIHIFTLVEKKNTW